MATQYLLSVFMDESDSATTPSDADMQRLYRQVDAVNAELKSTGCWVFAGGLHPSSSATVVRADHEQDSTTDGPYAETKEHIGGFWVIKADDLVPHYPGPAKHLPPARVRSRCGRSRTSRKPESAPSPSPSTCVR